MRISRNGPEISHLFFADDVLLFTKARTSQVRVVMDTLDEFQDASGLRVNLDKSKAICSTHLPRRVLVEAPLLVLRLTWEDI